MRHFRNATAYLAACVHLAVSLVAMSFEAVPVDAEPEERT